MRLTGKPGSTGDGAGGGSLRDHHGPFLPAAKRARDEVESPLNHTPPAASCFCFTSLYTLAFQNALARLVISMLVRQSRVRLVQAGGGLALLPRRAPTSIPAAVGLRRAATSSSRRPAAKSDLVPEVTPKTRAKRGSPLSTSAFVERYIPNLSKLYQKVGKRSTETAVARPSSPSSQTEVFRKSLRGGRVAKLSNAYREMMAKVEHGSEPPITVAELRAAIQLVGRTGTDDHWTLLETMVQDLNGVFGSPPMLEDYRAVLYFLANSSTPRAAFSRLETIPLSVSITTTDFNIVLAGLSRANDLEAVRTCIEQLPLLDLQPDEQTMLLYLRGLFAGHSAALPEVDLAALRAEVSKALDIMRPRGLPESPDVWAVLAEGYLQVGDLETSRKATDALRAALRHARYESLSPVPWTSLVRCTSAGESTAKALREVLAMKEAGVTPDATTAQALIETAEVSTVDQVRQLLQQVESVTGVRSTAPHWAVLIDRVAHSKEGHREGLQEAIKVYKESRKMGVDPSADLILPIIARLCNPAYPSSAQQREEDLHVALNLYDDLLAAEQERYLDIIAEPVPAMPYATDAGALLEPRTPSFGPTVEVYDILLEGISSSRTLRSHDQAWELLGDMKERGLYFETAVTVRHIKAFMARANSHKYAFGCYDRFLKLHPPALGASKEAFLAIADTFIHSTHAKLVNPHPRLVLEFINDMRRAGFDEGHAVMTTLLSQLANLSYTGAEMSTREENATIMKRMAWCTRLAVAWCRTDPFIKVCSLELPAAPLPWLTAHNALSRWTSTCLTP